MKKWLVMVAVALVAEMLTGCGEKSEIDKLRQPAERGDASAQYQLGVCYDKGAGVQANEAVKWYRKAAEQGYAAALCNLGVC